MALHALYEVTVALAWLVALNWARRVAEALRNLPQIPDLCAPKYVVGPAASEAVSSGPLSSRVGEGICVIVPACDEEATIGETLKTLLASKGVAMETIAVDDRSRDATGAIMDRVAAEPGNEALRVIHVTELPPGWLGKPHAMALAARQTHAEWLLFTDGDIFFDPELLRRALRFMVAEKGDHLTLYPTLILESFGERMFLCCVHVLAIWMVRPWNIADPKAVKDSMGIGAFNLIRREVYTAIGGYESLRMEVLDDVRLGYKVKRAGFRQRVTFGRDLIRLRWGVGARGMMHNLTKNAFAVFGYRVPRLIGACFGLAILCFLPLVPVLFLVHLHGLWHTVVLLGPAAIQFGAIGLLARYQSRQNGIPPLFAATFPIGSCLMIYSMLRSMVVTLRRGGVGWRGTLYPLSELRKHVGPVR
jgi:glycosyltransferase involved in cell wall biosynthesis